jgi:hypothetical protein
MLTRYHFREQELKLLTSPLDQYPETGDRCHPESVVDRADSWDDRCDRHVVRGRAALPVITSATSGTLSRTAGSVEVGTTTPKIAPPVSPASPQPAGAPGDCPPACDRIPASA